MNAREWLRRQRSQPTPEQSQFFLEAGAEPLRVPEMTPLLVHALTAARRDAAARASAGEGPACGCWPQYITCRCAVRAETGA